MEQIDIVDAAREVKVAKKAKANVAEDLFAHQCRRFMLPAVERQHRFNVLTVGEDGKLRRWRFDFAFPHYKLAVEIDGVIVRRIGGKMVTTGCHSDVAGMRRDNEKINSAILQGWSVLRFLQSDVKPGTAIETTMRVLNARGWMP